MSDATTTTTAIQDAAEEVSNQLEEAADALESLLKGAEPEFGHTLYLSRLHERLGALLALIDPA